MQKAYKTLHIGFAGRHQRPVYRSICVFLYLASTLIVLADWKDDVGYTRLNQTFSTGVPTAVANGVTQAEAGDSSGNAYQPDFTHIEFSGKTLTAKSPGTGISGHATAVGTYYYGNSTSLIPATIAVDSYNADGWVQTDFLNYNSKSLPKIERRRVQNHSWISIFNTNTYTYAQINTSVSNYNQRLDYAINRDGFLAVVGVNNGTSTVLPELLCQSYNGLAVGLTSGAHSAGFTAYDGTGRMKPDLVSYESLTSFSTPQVASAAGLISEKIRLTYPGTSLGATADYPRLTKALLLAGATKDSLSPPWTRANTAQPYDAVYGAGALNVMLSYRILAAGSQTASTSALVAATGWAVASVDKATNKSSRTYFFDLPAGTSDARFSCALSWSREVTATEATTFGSTPTLANLDLRLYAVPAGTFTLPTSPLDSSLSTVDNVEHVYQAALSPGRYALQISSTSTTATRYALTWRSSPTVTVVATTPTAREQDGTVGAFTLTRTGATTSPLLVPLNWGGTAVAGVHYATPPSSVLIPAGNSSSTVTITPIADDLAQGNRSVTLTVAKDFSLSAGAAATTTVTLEDKPYDTWRFNAFTTAELADNALSGPTADPDADGLANLMEYALGAAPKTADSTLHQPTASIANDFLTLTYTRPNATADLSYSVEWSSNLADWSSGSAVTTEVSRTANLDGTTTVSTRAVAALSTSPRQFLRLRVSRL